MDERSCENGGPGANQEALEVLYRHKRINFYENPSQARSVLVDEFIEINRNDFSKGVIITNSKYDVLSINKEIREKLLQIGLIDKEGFELKDGKSNIVLAKGDRIILTRKDYFLEGSSGQRGTVDYAKPTGVVGLIFDNGESLEMNTHKYNDFDYGWAYTTHKAQGLTVDHAIVYGFSNEAMASKQATYVQISRAREETKLYIVVGKRVDEHEGEFLNMDEQRRINALDQMKECWSYNATKDTTLAHTSFK